MAKLKGKISGSTLIEVLVAIVVIVTVFSISFVILANSGQYYLPRQKQAASVAMHNVYLQTIKEQQFSEEVFHMEGIKIEKSVSSYKSNKKLKVLTLKSYSKSNKKLITKEYVFIPNKDE